MITKDDVSAALERIRSRVHETPLLSATRLGNRAGGIRLMLKCESMQRTGSFKARGALNALMQLSNAERAKGVVTVSTGNHAQAVSWAAATVGSECIVVMPEGASAAKIEATKGYGGKVELVGGPTIRAFQRAEQLAAEGRVMVHPFADPRVAAGQGTVALEILKQSKDLDAVIVPIGGGGLISGVSMAMKQRNPRLKVIGVESSGAPGMQRSVREGHVVTLDTVDCVIDGLRVTRVGTVTHQIVSQYVDDIVTLPDRDIFDAVVWVMERCKLVVEGAAAAPVAALLHGLIEAPPGTRVACVLSGGNVNLDQLRGLSWN